MSPQKIANRLVTLGVLLASVASAADFGLDAPNPRLRFALNQDLEVNQDDSNQIFFVKGRLVSAAQAAKAPLSCSLKVYSDSSPHVHLTAGVTYVTQTPTSEATNLTNPAHPKGGVYKFAVQDPAGELKGIICIARDRWLRPHSGLRLDDLWNAFGSYVTITEQPRGLEDFSESPARIHPFGN
jgi:hypothetical protein